MKIGILGGTFDPIHNGHLYLAKKLLKRFFLDKIIFIPVYLPPHKKNIKITPAMHRFNMIKLAIQNNKNFTVSDIELKRRDRSYSIETLRQLRKQYGASTDIFFITGSDSLRELNKWKDLKGILKLCKFVIVKRPGFAIKKASKDFIILHINALPISATDIRKKLRKKQPITLLVSKKVRDYICKHSLY